MKFYYRYLIGNKSVFEVVADWIHLQTKKRHGKEWMKEHRKLTRKINWNIRWLPEYNGSKKAKYYFTEKGVKKYEKTLFKVHKEILGEKISKKKFDFVVKEIKGNFFVYEKHKQIGKLVHEDKFQIGVMK